MGKNHLLTDEHILASNVLDFAFSMSSKVRKLASIWAMNIFSAPVFIGHHFIYATFATRESLSVRATHFDTFLLLSEGNDILIFMTDVEDEQHDIFLESKLDIS